MSHPTTSCVNVTNCRRGFFPTPAGGGRSPPLLAACGLELVACRLRLLSIGHIDARQFAARLGELVFTISNIQCVSIPALSTILAFIALISCRTCPALS